MIFLPELFWAGFSLSGCKNGLSFRIVVYGSGCHPYKRYSTFFYSCGSRVAPPHNVHSSTASSGSHFTLKRLPSAKPINRNNLPPTLKTRVSSPKGNPSVAPGFPRQKSRNSSIFNLYCLINDNHQVPGQTQS